MQAYSCRSFFCRTGCMEGEKRLTLWAWRDCLRVNLTFLPKPSLFPTPGVTAPNTRFNFSQHLVLYSKDMGLLMAQGGGLRSEIWVFSFFDAAIPCQNSRRMRKLTCLPVR